MATHPPTEDLVLAIENADEPTITSHYDDLPISTLSPEILVEIFNEAQRNQWGKREGRRLIQITWVCRHWRNVALDAPSLWAYIGMNNAGYAMEFLTRSKQAELDISLASWMTEELALAVASQIHRIMDLSLITGPNAGNLLTAAAPVLQVCEIHNYPIPNVLFSGIAPKLFDISLHNSPSATCAAIPTCPLRILSIKSPKSRLRLPEVVEILSRFPALESVYLHSVFDDSDHGGAGSKVVDIPKLDWMHLGNLPIQLAIQFLKQVRLNNFTRLSTTTNRDGITTALVMELFTLSITARSSLVMKLNIRQDSSWVYGQSHLVMTTTSEIQTWINHKLFWDETIFILKQLPL